MSRITLGFIVYFLLSAQVLAFNDGLLPQIPIGEPGEKAGDMISPTTRLQVAAWCDFSKQITIVNGIYVCVYNGSAVGQQ